jgi:hypothetical protein
MEDTTTTTNKFSYVDKGGQTQEIESTSATTALGNMPSDADPKSGVMPTNNLVVSSRPAQREFVQEATGLSKILGDVGRRTPSGAGRGDEIISDQYTQLLDSLAMSSDNATKALIGTIQAQRANMGARIEADFDNYARGLQALGIQQNRAVATPDLLMGQIKKIENERMAKLQQLDIEMNKSLMDAQMARDEKQLGILKEKMSYIKEIKKERDNYLKTIADQMAAEASIAGFQAEQMYDTLQTLSEAEKEQFIVAVSEKYGINPLAIVKALGDVAMTKEDRAFDTKKREKEFAQIGVKSGSGSGSVERRYTAGNIPAPLLSEVQGIFKEAPDLTLDELYELFPEISVSFLNTLHGKLGKKDAKGAFDSIKPTFAGDRLKKKNIFTKGKLTKLEKAISGTSITIDELRERYDQGYSIKQIAQAFDLTAKQYEALEKASK